MPITRGRWIVVRDFHSCRHLIQLPVHAVFFVRLPQRRRLPPCNTTHINYVMSQLTSHTISNAAPSTTRYQGAKLMVLGPAQAEPTRFGMGRTAIGNVQWHLALRYLLGVSTGEIVKHFAACVSHQTA